jgi:hypothetical protein
VEFLAAIDKTVMNDITSDNKAQTHTPGPWQDNDAGLSHDDLVEALELCEAVLAELARLDDGTPSVSALHAARAALAKAKGRDTRAANRPGDEAAILHEETGIPYERCLVMCNMD